MKQLPSCSRCITKGIKCEPRSTRRTSDNSYRTNIKKPFVSPKRYHSSSAVPTLSRHASPRSIPSSNRQRAMRAASHIDFRTAVKMSQQGSGISGYPMLTPLPTYASQIVDECYSYSSSPEQNLSGFTDAMDANNFHNSGRLTPQTPEPIIYHEPVSMGDNLDPYMNSQPWSEDALASVGLGFESDLTSMLPTDMWSAPEAEMIPMAHMSWPQPGLNMSPQHMAVDLASHTRGVPSLTTSECSVEDFNSISTNPDEWPIYHATTPQLNMINMVTSAPFMQDMNALQSHAPIWEDVYMPGHSPY